MAFRKKIRLGDLLVDKGLITSDQLQLALQEQKKLGRKLGSTLVELGMIDEDSILKLLSNQLSIPLIDLTNYTYNEEVIRTLSESIARRYRAIVLEDRANDYLVGMADPTDLYAVDEIQEKLSKPLTQAIVRENDLLVTFDKVYRRTEEINALAEELGQELSDGSAELSSLLQGEMTDAPVAKLLQSIFEDAVQMGASDVHIEPDKTEIRIRQRVDGILHEQVMKEIQIAPAVVVRLKLMADLNISEKRLPQDGRFNMVVSGREIDVRLSTMPVQHGESVVMRILDQTRGALDIEHLGMPPALLKRFRKNFHLPNGMILVTGPTGSGKTTSLYAALQELNKAESKIITVEDPVEYQLSRVNQVQVNSKIGLNFAQVLRAALRQDPDIIMVGEMRDAETVEIGVSAAMTGHLVLSTLHTNDTVSTATRLIGMGVEGYLLATTLRSIIAQRLIRRTCTSCAQDYTPDAFESGWLRDQLAVDINRHRYKKGKGCLHCGFSGYHGRMGVYELLDMNTELAEALRRDDTQGFVEAAGRAQGYEPLVNVAHEYASQGLTTIEEVLKLAGQSRDELLEEESEELELEPEV
ncbi:MAG: Flp pilus assembly complex ATPase component TadA [Gammaproteobacteria bacterium]|nr:Flp pilus assembly complex ATPase component TadA [Gammaproteobacteria bacterium]